MTNVVRHNNWRDCTLRIINIFRRFSKNKKPIMTQPEALEKITWSDTVKECYDIGLSFIYPVAKVIYSDDKTERAVILQKSDILYTISFEKLYPFDDEELKYTKDSLHGYWSPNVDSMKSIFDSEANAINAIFSEPPFKYNKRVVWADTLFRIDADYLYWIENNDKNDPDDLCLHGHVFAKLGDEIFEYDATVSATGLYLLRTLTDNHIIHKEEHMLPCCGHLMIANDDLSSVDIGGCPNGIDWSVIHEGGNIKFITETGKTTFVDMYDYRAEVFAFTDKIEEFYKKCSPKNLLKADEMSRDAYTAFWNEWCRRKVEVMVGK